MNLRFDAVFEDGVIKPLEPLEVLPEHTRVSVSLDFPRNSLNAISETTGWLSDEDAAEIKAIIEAEFEQIDERDWPIPGAGL